MAILLLSGCAGMSPQPPGDPRADLWAERQSRLSCVSEWRLRARVALRAGDQGGSGRLTWRQWGERYSLRLTGPMGWGGVELRGDEASITVTADGRRRHYDSPPSEVLAARLGYELPLSGLRYWLLALPAPGAPVQVELDPWGRPARLSQSGWEIVYESYQRAAVDALPSRLRMSRGEVEVTVAIADWTDLGPAECSPRQL